MYPKSFDYVAPKSLGEALELLGGSPEVKVLAGGQSLIPSLKLRVLSPEALVDITRIKDLCYVRHEGHVLVIGALTTVAAVANDRTVASSFPVLREAGEQIADPLVRNRGTIGGNLCNANPINDLPAVMLALNASMVAMSRRGSRRIDADSFFTGAGHTALAPEEILTQVEIPVQGAGFGSAYRKVRKGSGGFSIAGVASCLSVAGDGTIARCRIAMTAVGPSVLRAENAERALLGEVPSDSVLDHVAALAADASHPSSDLTASEEYRRNVLHKLVEEAAHASYERAMTQ
jgi:Aerobic-type carbon monoxide dehydrogenase, middle subunit CoxM/CutM homologs